MCVFKKNESLRVYADGGAQDPSVLSCNKSRAEVNAESSSEYEHDQRLSDKPTVRCVSRIGRQTAS